MTLESLSCLQTYCGKGRAPANRLFLLVCKARCDIHNLFGLSGVLQTVEAICSCKNSATLPVAPALKT